MSETTGICRYPYADYGYPYDPNAKDVVVVEEEPYKASPRIGIGAQEPDKEDDTALIAAIMEEPEEDKAQYTVTTSRTHVIWSEAESLVFARWQQQFAVVRFGWRFNQISPPHVRQTDRQTDRPRYGVMCKE